MSPRRAKKSEKVLPSIDWQKLLIGRPSPPKQWWVGEAIQRDTSDSELRAEAALTLLLIPIGEERKPGSALIQLPELANRYRNVYGSEVHFAATMLDDEGKLHPDIYRVAVHQFLLFDAASRAVNPPPIEREGRSPIVTDPLVPELRDLAYKASLVVKALRKRGVETDLGPGTLLRDLPGHPVKRSAKPKAAKAKAQNTPVTAAQSEEPIHPATAFLL